MAILGVSVLRNPWTDWLKIGHKWLVGDLTSYAKYNKIRQDRAFRQKWNTPGVLFIFFFCGVDFSTASTEK